MRPVPLTLDLLITRDESQEWPNCSCLDGPRSYACLYSLNAALALAAGIGGWSFTWRAFSTVTGPADVPAQLDSVTARSYPRPGDPAETVVEASAVLRSDIVPVAGAVGDVGERVALRLGGAVWRYDELDGGRQGLAVFSVEAVRTADVLRGGVELYRAPCRV